MPEHTSFELVQQFHDKFNLERPETPQPLDSDTFEFRLKFMREELEEYREAHIAGDLEGMFDALVDLKYVVDGTADLHGFPMDEGTAEVQRANMSKRRAESADESKRGSALDVVKPEGWKPPEMDAILRDAGCEYVTVEEFLGAVCVILSEELNEKDIAAAYRTVFHDLDLKTAFRLGQSPREFVENNNLI
jgi:predicted HAD superfamily Cof-like phosphohydrolase